MSNTMKAPTLPTKPHAASATETAIKSFFLGVVCLIRERDTLRGSWVCSDWWMMSSASSVVRNGSNGAFKIRSHRGYEIGKASRMHINNTKEIDDPA